MKRLFIILAGGFIILSLFSECKSSKSGKLYITDETYSPAEIFTVKILEHTYNESSEKNIFSDYSEKISYGGYTWYVYDIPEGTWDIYLEYYIDGDFNNERESVYIESGSSANEWAAVWLLDFAQTDYSVWKEQGSGAFTITSSMFN